MSDKRNFSACSGCSLCLLSCPVWRSTHDIRLTPHGRAKAMQHGASANDLLESIGSCTLCGACEPACPENIDLIAMVTGLRGELPSRSEILFDGVSPAPTDQVSTPTILLINAELANHPSLVTSITHLFGGDIAISLASDSGTDISLALCEGVKIADERLSAFLAPLKTTLRVIAADGHLQFALKSWLPGVTVVSLGEALSTLPPVRGNLRDGDLYVIEAVAFHRDHARLISHYDNLRLTTGCTMNLDLQRMAIPATFSARHSGRVNADDQVRWILEGRQPSRIVVEDVADIAAFQRISNTPVVHLAAVAS